MVNLAEIADSCIPEAQGHYQLHKVDYDTGDIIQILKNDHPRFLSQTKEFSKQIPGETIVEYLRNLFSFLKENVKYKQDEPGTQLVKSPAQVWKDKFCDCKSYSLFIGTTLENAGIPYLYRFVSFSDSPRPTHVYIIVPYQGKYITMDAVMPGFNQEKPFKYNKDMNIRGLYSVSGIGTDKIIDLGNKDIADISEAEMELLIARDRLATAKKITEGMAGIGSLKASRYQDDIDMINDALAAINGESPEEDLQKIAYHSVSGVYTYSQDKGSLTSWNQNRELRERQRKSSSISGISAAELDQIGATKTGKFLKKVGTAVKKAAVTVAKVATAPARLVIKGILELTLPKSAPYFLYLFIDKKNLASMPASVKSKREKQEKIFNFIVKGVGMKESHVMGILRNGIIKEYKKEPEKVLADMMLKKSISGISGTDPKVISTTTQLIKQLGGNISISDQDAPDPADFSAQKLTSIKRIQASKHPLVTNHKAEIIASGPYFLYLFINDPKLFEKLPEKVRIKRKKQEQVATFISASTKIPRAQLMILWREGIQKQLGKTPEVYLADEMKRAISGDIGFAISAAAVSAAISIIKKIAELLKKKSDVDVSDKFAATTDDWKDFKANEAKEMTEKVVNQEKQATLLVNNDQETQSKGGTSIWNSLG